MINIINQVPGAGCTVDVAEIGQLRIPIGKKKVNNKWENNRHIPLIIKTKSRKLCWQSS